MKCDSSAESWATAIPARFTTPLPTTAMTSGNWSRAAGPFLQKGDFAGVNGSHPL